MFMVDQLGKAGLRFPNEINGLDGDVKPQNERELWEHINSLKSRGYNAVVYEWECPPIIDHPEVVYICVFRNPYERLISDFNYTNKCRKKRGEGALETLDELVTKGDVMYYHNYNCMFNFLNGTVGKLTMSPEEHQRLLCTLGKIKYKMVLEQPESFAPLEQHLNSKFDFKTKINANAVKKQIELPEHIKVNHALDWYLYAEPFSGH